MSEHKKTSEILKCFEEISKIPRCSKHEEKIAQWLMDWAQKNNLAVKTDRVKNIVIKVPGSAGYEKSPAVVLQGHMDMVCEKTPDSPHDFNKDPIKLVYDGEWLTADRTTLGADNGIAIAMSMVVALDKDIPHPPLELLFTVDEETGLTGANALEPGFIDGKILINIDSEDEGVFTVGCAGGINSNLSLPLVFEQSIPAGFKAVKIVAGGMKGGHSGIDIALGKANAIKIMARSLRQLLLADIDARLAYIKGGSAHNAIPRDCEAVVMIPEKDVKQAGDIVARYSQVFASEFNSTDPDLSVTVTEAGSYNKMVTREKTAQAIDFILAIPHGVSAMSPDIPGLVETSNNLANAGLDDSQLKILTSQRSSVPSRLSAHTDAIEGVPRLGGGEGRSSGGYPPWPPRMDSPLLKRSKDLYKNLFKREAKVEVIHAGLECGIIGDRNPGMDMISIGPTLRYPHSPDEKIHVGSIGMVWDFLAALLKDLK